MNRRRHGKGGIFIWLNIELYQPSIEWKSETEHTYKAFLIKLSAIRNILNKHEQKIVLKRIYIYIYIFFFFSLKPKNSGKLASKVIALNT